MNTRKPYSPAVRERGVQMARGRSWLVCHVEWVT